MDSLHGPIFVNYGSAPARWLFAFIYPLLNYKQKWINKEIQLFLLVKANNFIFPPTQPFLSFKLIKLITKSSYVKKLAL